MIELTGKYTNAKIMIDDIDENCMSQIIEMINHEAFTHPIAIMPDCHSGKGSVIGFTMSISNKLIPNIVGVDIGCGMLSCNIGHIEKIDYAKLDQEIREKIPFGFSINKKSKTRVNKEFADICKKIDIDFEYAIKSLGTLGGGNHFIEIGNSASSGTWITVHSGSRNFGKKVCEYWQKIASFRDQQNLKISIDEIKQNFEKKLWNKKIKEIKQGIKKIQPSELDFLENHEKDNYIGDMRISQEYAESNRKIIMDTILDTLKNPVVIDRLETVHNFIDMKDHIIRKGAIRSYIGERMIIPFNMRDGILICEGKTNPEWNFSAPHGAGRIYSRSKAKSDLNLEKFKDDMKNIFSTSVGTGTLDESPDAYKDPKIIEKCIEPTAVILDRIIPVHNMKDISEERPWKKERKLV